MKIISHRGNLVGRTPDRENHPNFVIEALDIGFDVEIDVWCKDGTVLLGHDMPQHRVEKSFVLHPNLWCHAKDLEALCFLSDVGAHYFWHENDRFTMTSKGIVWCFPNNYHPKGVTVVEGNSHPSYPVWGICTDYPTLFIK